MKISIRIFVALLLIDQVNDTYSELVANFSLKVQYERPFHIQMCNENTMIIQGCIHGDLETFLERVVFGFFRIKCWHGLEKTLLVKKNDPFY